MKARLAAYSVAFAPLTCPPAASLHILRFFFSLHGRFSYYPLAMTRGGSEQVPRYRLCRSEECLGAVWFCTAASPRVPLNVAEELELNVMVAGNLVLAVGSDVYHLSAGDAVWLAPGQARATTACSPDLAMWALMFRPRLIEELGHVQRLELHAPAVRTTLSPATLTEFSNDAYRLLRNQQRVPCFNMALATTLLNTWRVAGTPAGATPQSQHIAVATAVHILRNSPDRLTLPTLAKHVGLSPFQLSRLFHQQVGVPLSFYAAHSGIQRFGRFSAQNPSRNTLQCALSAGFGSYTQFYRSFSLVVGLRPQEHRKHLSDSTVDVTRYVTPELPCANPIRAPRDQLWAPPASARPQNEHSR